VTQCQEKDNNCPLMGVTTRQHSGAPKQVLTIRGSGWQQVHRGGCGPGGNPPPPPPLETPCRKLVEALHFLL
jgi:hypothetical protein